MTELFTLAVVYNGKEYHFCCALKAYTYTYKIAIDVDGAEVLFEPDEERHYRAVVPATFYKEIDAGLLKAIAEELHTAFA